MLNHTSRHSEENAEASPLLRPLAIFFVIALMLAATAWQPVEAASRERTVRHATAARLQPQSVRRRAHSVAARRGSAGSQGSRRGVRRVQSSEGVRGSRGHRHVSSAVYSGRMARRGAGRGRSGRAHLERVEFERHSASATMLRPVPGANSLVEAAPGSVSSGGSRVGDNAGAGALGSPLSASEMADAAVQPRVFPIYTRTGHLIVPPPLRGSREILMHQNEMADAAGLERIEND
ncbi:MAG TPA: hypothetical protein VGM11_01180, partial [Acidobacteriaceae bacterium]